MEMIKRKSWSIRKEESIMKRAVICVNTIDYSFPHKFSKAYLVTETKKLVLPITRDCLLELGRVRGPQWKLASSSKMLIPVDRDCIYIPEKLKRNYTKWYTQYYK